MIMQSLFLHEVSKSPTLCGSANPQDSGLNTIVILSLYFNGVCILYAFSTLCTTSSGSNNSNKLYQKEIERLRDYYENSGGSTQTRVVAEFYIEDNVESQCHKLQALIDYIKDN
jgi:hypothetical protein